MTSDGPTEPPENRPPGDRPDPGGEPRHRRALEFGEQLRRIDLRTRETAEQLADVADNVSQVIPRVSDLEEQVAGIAGALEAIPGTGTADPALALTPAIGWSQLPAGDRGTAWDTLGMWVDQILTGDYELDRVQLPDCWPVHRRAVRELAWLRTLHVAAAAPQTRPDVVAEWHTRWLPTALINIATAIDPRECAPGRHRLTEAERRAHEDALEQAQTTGAHPPVLTTEDGPGRPRYLPDWFPPRRSGDDGPRRDSPRPRSLDKDTPPPPSSRECWWPYFLDARLADIGGQLPPTP